MKRTKLCDRLLPVYSRSEEIMNMVTHIVGGAMALGALGLCIWRADRPVEYTAAAIYGLAMVLVYTMSSVYHGLLPGMGKKVLQVLDHCAIYFLIAGTYTPILLLAFAPRYPIIGWGLLGAQWALAALAVTLTAIDLKRYRVLSMACYIGMGWGIVLFLPQALEVLTTRGFGLLLAGGISYTVGAVLFGLGKRLKWMHSVFHIFVVLGSLLQLLAVVWYVF